LITLLNYSIFRRCRERDFLKKVHERIEDGGKVLIPVFALGRAQELCILLESYWDRMNLKVWELAPLILCFAYFEPGSEGSKSEFISHSSSDQK